MYRKNGFHQIKTAHGFIRTSGQYDGTDDRAICGYTMVRYDDIQRAQMDGWKRIKMNKNGREEPDLESGEGVLS